MTRIGYGAVYAGLRILGLILGSVRLEHASGFCGSLWRNVGPWLGGHERALWRLNAAFPDMTWPERKAIALAMWENEGRAFGEAFHLAEIVAGNRVTIDNAEVLERWAARPGGKVACAEQHALWTLTLRSLSRHCIVPMNLDQRTKSPLLDIRVGARGILLDGRLLRKNPALPKSFMAALREGGAVGVLGNPFAAAQLADLSATMARAVDRPVLVTHVRRLPGIRFRQSIEVIDIPLTEDRHADVQTGAALIATAFERYSRAAPEQWDWAAPRLE